MSDGIEQPVESSEMCDFGSYISNSLRNKGRWLLGLNTSTQNVLWARLEAVAGSTAQLTGGSAVLFVSAGRRAVSAGSNVARHAATTGSATASHYIAGMSNSAYRSGLNCHPVSHF